MDGEEFPPGWAWATLGELIERIESGKNVSAIGRPPENGEVGIVKVSAVTWGEFDEDASKTLPLGVSYDPDDRIAVGDFLISRANTLELVGAPVIVRACRRALTLSDKVLRLRFKMPIDRWIELFLKSAIGRQQIEGFSQGAQLSMRNISQENLRRIKIPIAPAAEIRRIQACLDDALKNFWKRDAISHP
jgi:type I restriction enzyme, S subunit